jgi:RNA polymerase sigma-70 factor (ECF subfamily)
LYIVNDRRRSFEVQALPHLDAAYNLARWLSRSPADADDIVQDAMLRAFRAFDGFRGGDIKPWLLTIVRNCSRNVGADIKRRAHAPLPEEDTNALVSTEASPEMLAMQASETRKLDETIALLPNEFREVLILREMEDMSYREIAEVTGVPIGTVMSRLARARALLKEKWMAETRL